MSQNCALGEQEAVQPILSAELLECSPWTPFVSEVPLPRTVMSQNGDANYLRSMLIESIFGQLVGFVGLIGLV